MRSLCRRQDDRLILLEAEDVPEMAQLTPPHETGTELAQAALQPVVGLTLIIKLEVFRLLLVQAVFEREIIEVGSVLF